MGFLSSLFVMLKDFVTSKKVLTAAITAVATALIKDPGLRTNVVEIGAVLLAGQGLADHGKAAAQIKSDSSSSTNT